MSCLIKSRSVSLQSSTCFRFTELQVPERIFQSDARRTRGVYCYSQGNKTGRKNEKVGTGGGFSSLATLLQQRLAEEKKSRTSKKVVKGELNQRSISTGKNSLEQVRTREKKVAVREEYPTGSIEAADTSLHEEVPKEVHQPLTKEEQAFSEAVLAALKESALERQREQRRRSNSRKGKRPSERTVVVEEKRVQVEDVKPLAIKPEWRGMIASLENKLDKLKQDYYNRV